MPIKITKPNERTDRANVDGFETVIGKKLPDDYREFLFNFNGGRPESNEFSVPAQKSAAGINLFYGLLKAKEWGDLLYQREMLMDRVPKDVLPIGEASCGNAVCLSLRPDTYGQIFFWDHELEADEGQEATFSNLFLISNSFTGFLSDLEKFDINQVQLKPGQVKSAWIDPEFLKSLKGK